MRILQITYVCDSRSFCSSQTTVSNTRTTHALPVFIGLLPVFKYPKVEHQVARPAISHMLCSSNVASDVQGSIARQRQATNTNGNGLTALGFKRTCPDHKHGRYCIGSCLCNHDKSSYFTFSCMCYHRAHSNIEF